MERIRLDGFESGLHAVIAIGEKEDRGGGGGGVISGNRYFGWVGYSNEVGKVAWIGRK